MVATVESDTVVAVSVEAEGRVLVPGNRQRSPLQAITDAMAALAHFDEGDSVTVVVHGHAMPMTAWTGTSSYAALYWLATALGKACCASLPKPGEWTRRRAESQSLATPKPSH